MNSSEEAPETIVAKTRLDTETRIMEADVEMAVEILCFDHDNPRMPNLPFISEDEVIKHLIEEFDVDELVRSIQASGWIDYEPLIVQSATNVVFEGNRRLAALRLISDSGLRTRLEYDLPQIADAKVAPTLVRARVVANRQDARRFIAFKHINGAYKWDAFAKAKYAADWLDDGETIEIVSQMLGDNHNTIRRLVLGYNVLQQAQKLGFDVDDRTKKRFAFSHLYTATSRPAVRNFLNISDDDLGGAVPLLPVPENNKEQLMMLMSWLYGQDKKKEPTLIASQNPNLNQLVRVIENKNALATLIRSRRLDQAFEEVERPTDRFKEALINANKQCENALALSTYYDGDSIQLAMVKNLATTVRNLREAMIKKTLAADDDL